MSNINYISFPGLGIGEMKINRIALSFDLFGKEVEVMWYGVIITLAIIAAFTLACFRAKKVGVDFDSMLDFAIFTIPLSILGARLYYVIFSEGTYDSFVDVIAIWDGGLGIYGGVIVGFFTIMAVAKFKKIKFAKILDVIGPCVMIGQAIGRWGNFMNAEAYGWNKNKIALYEDLFIRMDIRAEGSDFVRHTLPTFLLESCWNIIGFIIIVFILERFKKFDGQSILCYFTWYGLGRGIIECFRSDSLYLFGTDSGIRVSSLLGFICFIAGTALLLTLAAKARRERLDSAEYENIYSSKE